jgi:hypothetical protein
MSPQAVGTSCRRQPRFSPVSEKSGGYGRLFKPMTLFANDGPAEPERNQRTHREVRIEFVAPPLESADAAWPRQGRFVSRWRALCRSFMLRENLKAHGCRDGCRRQLWPAKFVRSHRLRRKDMKRSGYTLALAVAIFAIGGASINAQDQSNLSRRR